ncbi:hypothetical protein B0T26DRAFT_753116 [Lasiosphaeria miniovina]|uniref:Uncharacterized protein n=1 Tax=Lasiosphaeria miniovina TaxID=1954250 RepID=A0AA40DTK7_9PEZI|nr:uncharacterized protein B0T26DRAFT_753116 [Lasiosphaeria miniovina]KAK0712941.1 hypothetical protein B0T26DRAFT_753116 [Lasiosphaeria miniovina]
MQEEEESESLEVEARYYQSVNTLELSAGEQVLLNRASGSRAQKTRSPSIGSEATEDLDEAPRGAKTAAGSAARGRCSANVPVPPEPEDGEGDENFEARAAALRAILPAREKGNGRESQNWKEVEDALLLLLKRHKPRITYKQMHVEYFTGINRTQNSLERRISTLKKERRDKGIPLREQMRLLEQTALSSEQAPDSDGDFATPYLLCLALSHSALGQPDRATTGWRAEPDGRGTFSLVLSCIVTLTLCVWSALHLNVPPRDRSLRRRVLDKAKWVLYGIFAPELVVATAAAQFIVARWLKREIEADAKARALDTGSGSDSKHLSSRSWTTAQCFYAVMGGFAADVSGIDDDDDDTCRRVTVTAEGVRLLSLLGRLPELHASQIEDKSKADWLAKSIVCAQAGWMVVQVVGRALQNLPVSLLELNTCGHVACALVIYLLWWSKPLDVQTPIVLTDADEDLLALMHLCSATSAVNGITNIRCFVHVANEEDERLWRLPSASDADHMPATPDAGEAPSQITTYLSVGSPGSRNPSQFLGFSDLWSESKPAPTARSSNTRQDAPIPAERPVAGNRAFRYTFNLAAPAIAPECLIYYSAAYGPPRQPSLRHSKYCRLVFADAAKPRKPLPPAMLQGASRAADALRAECAARPAYAKYYFTFVREMGHFLGETDYVVAHAGNFPSLHNLGLGQVAIHRDRLRSVLALAAAAYGALHCAGWGGSAAHAHAHARLFPTAAERALWLASALTIAASGGLLWAFFAARQLWPAFDRAVSGATPGIHIARVRAEKRAVIRAKAAAVYVVVGVFALARVFLVAEAFISLRDAPVEVYDTPLWTNFLPHL